MSTSGGYILYHVSETYNTNWKVIFKKNIETHIKITFIAQKRLIERKMRQDESGHGSCRGSHAAVIC